MNKDLKYKDLSDEEVEELIIKRLAEIKSLLNRIKALLNNMGD